MFYLRGPTEKIKERQRLDLLDVVGQVEVACEDLAFIRNDGAYEYFSCYFDCAVEMSFLIDIVTSMPQIAACQQHQENEDSDTPFNYYRKNMWLTFLHHLINGTDVRFNKYGQTVLMMQAFILSVVAERDVTIDGVVIIYKDDLPVPNNYQEDLIWWKRRWSVRDISERPQTIAQALKQCDSDAYPNLSVLLKNPGTVAVTSCKCKHSGSVLKRLTTYLWASKRQEKLSGLALMHINYDVEISVHRVMLIFVKKPRALEFQEHLF